MGKVVICAVVWSTLLAGTGQDWDQARELYQRTDYLQSLALLVAAHEKDAATEQLIGQNYFMLGEYKKATDAFERALAPDPDNASVLHWLGRAYGRRAEMASPFTAPGYATKARQMFEKSVALDPTNKDATGDLLDFYLDAPGFLGGGVHKAEALVKLIGQTDPAEGHYAQALLDDRRKEYDDAEQHLRRAAELAPRQVGRVVELAKYLAKRGQVKESEAMFDQAVRMAPNNPKILFERANSYINGKRNLGEARDLLEKYLKAPLTPDDPPRQQALSLLKKIGE
jgi:tetratricopeptide (TPR) repeat protein